MPLSIMMTSAQFTFNLDTITKYVRTYLLKTYENEKMAEVQISDLYEMICNHMLAEAWPATKLEFTDIELDCKERLYKVITLDEKEVADYIKVNGLLDNVVVLGRGGNP